MCARVDTGANAMTGGVAAMMMVRVMMKAFKCIQDILITQRQHSFPFTVFVKRTITENTRHGVYYRFL